MMTTPEDTWVNVTWMPHASLAQTSHVCFLVRSTHASLNQSFDRKPTEWKVRTTIHGAGGIPLVAVSSTTPSAPVLLRQRTDSEKSQASSNKLTHHSHSSKPKQPLWKLPSVSEGTHDCAWNQPVHVPVRWRDLPRDAYLLFEIIDHTGKIMSQAKMPFFTEHGRLSTGLILLDLEPSISEQGLAVSDTQPSPLDEDDNVWKASMMLDKLENLESSRTGSLAPTTSDSRKVFGRVQSTSWLDSISKEYCHNVISSATKSNIAHDNLEETAWKLIVELPVFDVPVMHEESFYPVPQQSASGAVSALDLSLYRKSVSANEKSQFHPLQLVNYVDYENEMDNPVEDKYRTLAHDLLRGLVDPALKPDREQRDRLAAIIASPSHHPTREEKDLLWRFRFSLVDNQRALTKFLLAVDWTVESEVVQAAELLEQWRRLDIPDALKLLGKHVAFQTNLVKTYAIETLNSAPDVELRLYLLQLVQALKYEANTRTPTSRLDNASDNGASSNISSLASFLIGRAAGNLQLANYLYWYLKVELKDPAHGPIYQQVFSALKARLSETFFRATGTYASHPGVEAQGSPSSSDSKSSAFKAIVSSVSSTVSSKLGSSLRGSEHSTGSGDRTKRHGQPRTYWDILIEQDEFISGLMDIQMKCRDTRGKKDAKEAELQSLLLSEGYDRNAHRDPVPLPSAPHVFVNGVKPDTAKMFKSALYPALVDFHVETTLPMIGEVDLGAHGNNPSRNVSSTAGDNPNIGTLDHLSHFKVIVKTGDDLRQDQLVIMLIQLMDGLLKRAALNLCLTPYSIIAMSPTSGLVEFVDGSMPISQVLSQYNGSIMQYFQAVAPGSGKYDVNPAVLSTYIRSCAGYCVITYLLAVGDRHLDNILMDRSGHFFHIDFGFILGRDPKPLPPAFRLTREMVEGMGGLESSEYRQFCSLACQAFNALRKSAGLILNLLHLMADAGIEDLSNNPSADAEGVIAKVEERFRLDLTDEQAERFFIGLINDCLAALAPRVMDVLHSLAVARR